MKNADDKVNILVVDDLPEKILVLETILADLGQNIVTAHSGDEALRRVLELDFSVILLDVNMPGTDGLETAAYIRRRKKSAHTPIIFMTAFADEFHTAQGYSLGAVDYILAPVVPEVLRTKVKVFVDLHRMTQQVRRQADERVALAQEQAARVAAEDACKRSSFLAEASSVFAGSLELEEILHGLLKLAVPRLAELAAVTLLGEPGQPWRSDLGWVMPGQKKFESLTLTADRGPQDALRDALERILATGKPETLYCLNVPYPPSGNPTPNEARLQTALILPLFARGRILGAWTLAWVSAAQTISSTDLAFFQDLASRAAIGLDNARLYREIQEADRRKNEFLAMLAHELRNPLAPIRNAVHILRHPVAQETTHSQAREMIDRQVTHMARLIDDLLDMSRLSRGKILLQKEAVDWVKVTQATVEDYRSVLEDAGIRVQMSLLPQSLVVNGDPVRLAQIIGNILHNASKFTDPGGSVYVELTRDSDSNSAVLSIRDTGIGIDAAMVPRVFETFSQADGSLDRSRGGLGLGLALVRGLVELHKGEVQAQSDGIGRGTKLVIRLPLLTVPIQEAQSPGKPSLETAVPRRILVIEDNLDVAESTRMLLEMAGHDVAVASHGAQGLETARHFEPEIVLCDIGLPGDLDGYGVARAFRKDPDLAPTYLIATSGYGQEEDQIRCREAGFDVHLTKPLELANLQRHLAASQVQNSEAILS